MPKPENINQKFYKKYKQNLQILHQHLQERNPNVAIDDFVAQKILDRLIFIRFANKIKITNSKFIEDFEILSWQNLLDLFRLFDQNFNKKFPNFSSELFKPLPILYELVVENDIFLAILRFLNLYDFRNDLKVDILGHIFEQSLNKNTNLRNKDGVFYTPEYITDYMINETLLKLLTEKKEEIYKTLEIDFISEFETDLLRWQNQNEMNRKKAAQIYTDFFIAYENVLKNIKILDPACGSGAFLTRVFDILLKEREIVYLEKQKAVDLFYENFAMSEIGRNILLENLFGVDLNKESTEITKLSLWLKTANRFVSLANLSENIKQGNSLIHDLSITDRAFDWQKSFPQVMENGGFDLILGNPPYFSISTLPENVQNFYQKNYKNADKSGDIYCVFFEKSLNLLKNNGILMFITSNQWLQTNYGRTLRNFFLENSNPELLVNFGGFKVFADATVDTSILLLRKTPCKHHLKACHVKNDFEKTQNLENYINENAIFLNDLQTDRWIIADDLLLKLREKIRNTGKKLKNWEIKINYGIKTGLNEAFIVDTETKEKLCEQIKINRGLLTGLNEAFIVNHSLKEKLCAENSQNSELFVPILRGRDVHQYQANWANLWLILTKNGVDIEKYPDIKKHLESFENIKKRSDQGENWWNLRACAYYEDFEKPKIIYPETTVRRSEFYLDLEKHYIDKTCFMITANRIEDLYYLLGILTSGLIEWYLEDELRTLGKITVQYSKQYVENIPIPVIKNEKQTEIYWQIVELMKNLKTADIFATKSILNELVAELFGLTTEEKAIKNRKFL